MEPFTDALEWDSSVDNHFHFLEIISNIPGGVDMQDFFVQLNNFNQDSLSKNDLDILHQLDKNFSLIPKKNIRELAMISYTSQASLSRLIKKIGFSGFTEFKLRVSDFLKQNNNKKTTIDDYLTETIEEIKLTHILNSDKIQEVAKLILSSSECYTFGTGWKQLQLLNNFSNDLVYYGKKFFSLRTKEDLIDSAKLMGENSLIIIASISGDATGYKKALDVLKIKKTKIISLTFKQDCELLNYSDIPLFFIDKNLSLNGTH